jgi:hypothetical protein
VTAKIKTVVHIRPVLWPACRSATPPLTIHPSIHRYFSPWLKSKISLVLIQNSRKNQKSRITWRESLITDKILLSKIRIRKNFLEIEKKIIIYIFCVTNSSKVLFYRKSKTNFLIISSCHNQRLIFILSILYSCQLLTVKREPPNLRCFFFFFGLFIYGWFYIIIHHLHNNQSIEKVEWIRRSTQKSVFSC